GCPTPKICGAQGQVDLTACAQYVGSNDLERAKVRCDLALQYCPDDADVHTNLGLIAVAENRWPDARASFVKALHLNPDESAAHNDLGSVYEHDGDLAHA